MVELGELEANHAEFAKRNTRVYVISLEDQATAQQTQTEHPHLIVIADRDRALSEAIQVIHGPVAPDGSLANAPTTLVLDGKGVVRAAFRYGRHIVRPTPAQVLQELDRIKEATQAAGSD